MLQVHGFYQAPRNWIKLSGCSWKCRIHDTLGPFTPALFSSVESDPEAFTPLVRFIWAGVNTAVTLGCEPKQPDLDFVEEVVCPVRLRYEHNPTEGNTLLFSRLPWSAFKCVIGCNWISVWRLILYEMSPPVVDREPSSGSYNASTGTFYSCVSQITIGKYTLF